MPMSASLEEMTSWSNRELLSELRSSLPVGWAFAHGIDPETGWWAVLKDAEGKVAWQQSQTLDERVLLFSVYGWLRFRSDKPVHPAWARRGELSRKFAVGRMTLPGVEVPDPEDLNRDELLNSISVYLTDQDPDKRR